MPKRLETTEIKATSPDFQVERRGILIAMLAVTVAGPAHLAVAQVAPSSEKSGAVPPLQRLSEALNLGRFEGNDLEQIWENRHRLRGSLGEFARSAPEFTEDFNELIMISKLLGYVGYFVLPAANRGDRLQSFSLGFQVAERAIQLNKNEPDGYHWFAVNRMAYADLMGVFETIEAAESVLYALNAAVSLDSSYANGSGLRARGRLYLKMPPAPISFGDLDRSLTDLRAAQSLAPDDRSNLLSLAIAEFEAGNLDLVRKLISDARASPKTMGFLEDKVIERELDDLERKLK